MELKLFIIKNKKCDYDEWYSFAVLAESLDHALGLIATDERKYNSYPDWRSSSVDKSKWLHLEIKEVPMDKPMVVHDSFLHG